MPMSIGACETIIIELSSRINCRRSIELSRRLVFLVKQVQIQDAIIKQLSVKVLWQR